MKDKTSLFVILILLVGLVCIVQSWNRYEKFTANCAKSWWKQTSQKMDDINNSMIEVKKILANMKI